MTQKTNHKLKTTESQETHKNLVPETGDDNGNVFYKANDDDKDIDDKEGVVSRIINSGNKNIVFDQVPQFTFYLS